MSEQRMIDAIQGALRARGVNDEIVVAGHFNPRGNSGGMFAGGTIGADLAGGVGMAVGSLTGRRAASTGNRLPTNMLVGVTATTVYGFTAKNRRDQPSELVFELPRDELNVKVHERVNVRVLELIHETTLERIQLEGNRLPITHAKDVITELTG